MYALFLPKPHPPASTNTDFKYDDRTKLSLSHALSQSVKISLFEELIMGTIEQTKDIPKSLSETGKIGVRRFSSKSFIQVFSQVLLMIFLSFLSLCDYCSCQEVRL